MGKIWLAIALLVTLVACGQQARSYEGPQEIVDALSDSEIDCEDLQVDKGDDIGSTGHDPLIEHRGVCAIDDVEMTIYTFATEKERDDWLAVGGLLGPAAFGPNWAVSAGSDEVVDEIADALDARTEEV